MTKKPKITWRHLDDEWESTMFLQPPTTYCTWPAWNHVELLQKNMISDIGLFIDKIIMELVN